MNKNNIKYKNEIFKTYFTIFQDSVQGGTVSNMGPVSPIWTSGASRAAGMKSKVCN